MKNQNLQNTDDVRRFLYDRLEQGRSKNPSFSLRAFARTLRMSPATLSQMISGKRPITLSTAKKICEGLCLSPLEEQRILSALMRPDHSTTSRAPSSSFQLELDRFKLVSDWYHFAILSLTEIKASKPEPMWISRRLGIQQGVVKDAIDRLIRLGLLEVRGKRWRQITPSTSVSSPVPNLAIQKYHRQILEKAANSLNEAPILEREFGAITMAVNPDQIDLAKTMIREFRTNLSQVLEKGKKERVYTLAVQLFPLDQSTTKLENSNDN